MISFNYTICKVYAVLRLASTEASTGMLSVKLADFGLSISLREERAAVTRVGTTDYMVSGLDLVSGQLLMSVINQYG